MLFFKIRNKINVFISAPLGLALMYVFLPVACFAQSIQFSMDVKPELQVEVLQNLSFGAVITNSGVQKVELGDSGMGIFKIKALAAQTALLTLHPPDSLVSSETDKRTGIPVNLSAAYSPTPAGYPAAEAFKDYSAWISLGSGDRSALEAPSWENGYVFIFGDINVTDIPEGTYSGTLILHVEYQ